MKTFFGLFFFILIALVVGFVWLFHELGQPYQGFENEVFLEFPSGTHTQQMATQLAKKGIVREAWMFTAARALSPHSVLQAGEYRFQKPASAFDVFARIARGDTYYEVLTVPEGHNLFDIAEDLKAIHLVSPEQFRKAARNPALIRDLDPAAPSLEGYLFPDSYRLNRHSTAESLCRLMTSRFREQWKSLGSPANAHVIVTLASLIEREARLPAERPEIASVFENRLRLGMALGCDPTTVYAALLENRYRGTIYKSDLASQNPYNTYAHAGLPPGPIANPGLSSLKAAISPADTKYLYFVAKGDGSGGHNFSQTLAGHLSAVAQFRSR